VIIAVEAVLKRSRITGSGVFTLTATALYLDAQWDTNAQFIFQTATTVIASANTYIILINGALVKNIY
jgi:hypothetical protein